jgi:hypothetical protein
MTLSIMTLTIAILSIRAFDTVMQGVANKPIMLSVVMLNVVLSAVAPSQDSTPKPCLQILDYGGWE